jgi:hypothetical protein
VHQGYGTIELRLSLAAARGAEGHAAELLRRGVIVSLGETERLHQESRPEKKKREASSHHGLLDRKYSADID